MPKKRFYVYIMASVSGTLYIGGTNNIYRRVLEHRKGGFSSFTAKYEVNRLVYYEPFKYIGNAIAREKEIKGWVRAKKTSRMGFQVPVGMLRFAQHDNSWGFYSSTEQRFSRTNPPPRVPL